MRKLLFLTSQNTPVCLRLVRALENANPDCSIDVFYERRKKTPVKVFKSQLKHLRHHGLLWIPYRMGLGVGGLCRFICKLVLNESSDGSLLGSWQDTERSSLETVSSFRSRSFVAKVKSGQYDLGIVFGTRIIKPALFNLPRLGMVNIHQGLIPFYRGMPPAFWELFNEERECGITLHRVSEVLDGGDILYQKKMPIFCGETIEEVQTRLDECVIESIPPLVAEILADRVNAIRVDLSQGRVYGPPRVRDILELRTRRLRPAAVRALLFGKRHGR